MITLTPQAAEQVRRAARDAEAGHLLLRLAARRVGGEIEYGMGFDEERDSDQIVEVQGLTLLVAAASAGLLEGVTLDFVEYEPGDFRFIFIPPAAASCASGEKAGGCGGGCA